MPSPNYSSRGGAGVRLVCLHTAEGALTIESLGAYFASPSAGVSSHVGIDDKPNTIGEYVRREYKAWTAANYNPVAVQAELCAFAKWTPAEWNTHPTMLENCGRWIAEEAAAFGIPLVRLTAQEAQGGAYGVCQHVDLGAGGGGHWDCGTGFPMDTVLNIARGGSPAPGPTSKGEQVGLLRDDLSGGYWVAFSDGAVHAERGAPYLGGINNDTYNRGRWPCVGIEGNGAGGYVLAADAGNPPPDNLRARLYDFPRDGSGIP